MKTIPSPTPFTLSGSSEDALYQRVVAKTTGHPLWSISKEERNTPFKVPQGFWDDQYIQIIERKASPSTTTVADWVLRPAIACACCLVLLAGFYYQPIHSGGVMNRSVLMTDMLSTTSTSDASLLLEDELATPQSATSNTIDDEEVLF